MVRCRPSASYPPLVPESATLLIVDDEPQILRLLVRAFERHGCRVFSAPDADEAWTLFQAHPDDIAAVLLDVVIPPDGVDPLLSRLLGLREDLGVVLASGDALSEDLAQRLDALGGVFLRKPFSPAAAFDAVARVTAS